MTGNFGGICGDYGNLDPNRYVARVTASPSHPNNNRLHATRQRGESSTSRAVASSERAKNCGSVARAEGRRVYPPGPFSERALALCAGCEKVPGNESYIHGAGIPLPRRKGKATSGFPEKTTGQK